MRIVSVLRMLAVLASWSGSVHGEEKILFFSSVYHGHVVSSLQLVKELKNRNHTVIYYGVPEYGYLLEKLGVEYRPYPALDSLATFMGPRDFSRNRIELIAEWVEEILNVSADLISWGYVEVEKQIVSLIMHDHIAVWGHVLAQQYQIPSICSIGVMPINEATVIMTGEDSHYLDLSDATTAALTPFNQMYESGISSLLDLVSGQYTAYQVVYTSRYFQRHESHFPDGKYIFYPMRSEGVQLPRVVPRGPIRIYIALGTMFNLDFRLFRLLAESFRGPFYRVTLSLGSNKSPHYEALQAYQRMHHLDNLNVLPFVDQEKVLAESDIFVTHGGINSVSEAVCSGTPMVVVPLLGDQIWIAKQVEAFGAGLSVAYSPHDDEEARFMEGVESCVHYILGRWNQYQESLMVLKATLRDKEAAEKAIMQVQCIKNRGICEEGVASDDCE